MLQPQRVKKPVPDRNTGPPHFLVYYEPLPRIIHLEQILLLRKREEGEGELSCTKVKLHPNIAVRWCFPQIYAIQSYGGHLLFMSAKIHFPSL